MNVSQLESVEMQEFIHSFLISYTLNTAARN